MINRVAYIENLNQNFNIISQLVGIGNQITLNEDGSIIKKGLQKY